MLVRATAWSWPAGAGSENDGREEREQRIGDAGGVDVAGARSSPRGGPPVTATLAAAGGDRAALLAVGLAALAAAVAEVIMLARARRRPALVTAWAVWTALTAAAWLAAAAMPDRPRVALVAMGVLWVVHHIAGAALFWTRVRLRALPTVRVFVDVTTVGAAGAGLWVMARVPARLPDGSTVPDRAVIVVFGILATMTLAFGAVAVGHQASSAVVRINSGLIGLGGLAWADDLLRGGTASWTWAVLLVIAQAVAAVFFTIPLGDAQPRAGERADWSQRLWFSLRPGDDAAPVGIEPSPMIAGIVESVLWMLIVAFQLGRPIELAVVVAACTAAAAISARSMTRWLEQTRTVRSLQAIAATDPLTGLPNRRGFAQAMAACRPGALALIDLDGFKRVNDRLGHAAGDELLEAVAAEGLRHLPPGATLARLGGDEFGLVVPGTTADAVRVAEETIAAIATLRRAGHVTASAGVAEISDDVEATMRAAGYALHSAKRAGRGRTMQLSESMVDLELRRAQLAEALADDIEGGNLHIAYQPIVSLATRDTVGAEALARWTHPDHGDVAPDEFVPLAEELGLIDRVGDLVLDRVIAQVASWQVQGIVTDVAVNVSGLQLRGPEIAVRYAERVSAGGVAGRISIEVTESAIVDDEAIETLQLLRTSGFRCAIDDFGTGYASISSFLRIQPDRLKIDRRFVADLGTPAGASSEVLVSAVVNIAHQFGVEVVAEGVETAAALETLARIGCDYAQGYFIARPGSAADFVRAMARRVELTDSRPPAATG